MKSWPKRVIDYLIEVDHAPTGATQELDLAAGSFFTIDLESASNLTVSFTNTPQSGFAGSYVIAIVQGSTARTVAFTGVLWEGGLTPSVSTGEDDLDLVFLTYINGVMVGNIASDVS